jgi:hypothetical protein
VVEEEMPADLRTEFVRHFTAVFTREVETEEKFSRFRVPWQRRVEG